MGSSRTPASSTPCASSCVQRSFVIVNGLGNLGIAEQLLQLRGNFVIAQDRSKRLAWLSGERQLERRTSIGFRRWRLVKKQLAGFLVALFGLFFLDSLAQR